MSIELKSGSSVNKADVNAEKELQVALTKVEQDAGYAVVAGLVSHPNGANARQVRAIDVSLDRRLHVGLDNLFWDDVFNHAVLNLSRYRYYSSTATSVQTGNALVLNQGNSLASAAATMVNTWRTFPILGRYSLSFTCSFSLTQAPVANNVIDIGMGLPNTAAPYAPGDGVYIRITAGGVLQLVNNVNGTESTAAAIISLEASTSYNARIEVDVNSAELYINDDLQCTLTRPVNNHITVSPNVPVFFRLHNVAATSTAQNLRMTGVTVLVNDGSVDRPFSVFAVGQGNSSLSQPNGQASGQTANYANSAAPASATLSNTAAGYTTLGGQFQFAAVAAAETDYALFAYQVPVLTQGGNDGKNLVIQSIRIETYVTGAATATTRTVLQWSLGMGSSAVSLATADAVAGVRGPRRRPLGVQSFAIGSDIGTLASPIMEDFRSTIVVEPGSFLHIFLKMPVATATASVIYRGVVALDGYFE